MPSTSYCSTTVLLETREQAMILNSPWAYASIQRRLLLLEPGESFITVSHQATCGAEVDVELAGIADLTTMIVEWSYQASDWFENNFKPDMEVTLEEAPTNELAPTHEACLGTNPIADVTGISLSARSILCWGW